MYVCAIGTLSMYCRDTPFPSSLPIGVLERMSHLEGTVCDIQSGQDSLSQRMDRVEAQLEQRPLNRPQQQLLFATVGSSWQGVPVMQSQVARLLSNTTVLRHACE